METLNFRAKFFTWLGPFPAVMGVWSATAQILDYTNGKWLLIISAACLILSLFCAREVYVSLRRRKKDGNGSAFAASDWAALVSFTVTAVGSAAICVILVLATTSLRPVPDPSPPGSTTTGSTTTSATVKPRITSPPDGFRTNDTTVPVQVTAPPPAEGRKWMLAVQSSRRQDGNAWFYPLTTDGPESYSGKPKIGPADKDKARGIFTIHLVDVDAASGQAITQQAETNGAYYTDNGMRCPNGVRFYHQVKVERP